MSGDCVDFVFDIPTHTQISLDHVLDGLDKKFDWWFAGVSRSVS